MKIDAIQAFLADYKVNDTKITSSEEMATYLKKYTSIQVLGTDLDPEIDGEMDLDLNPSMSTATANTNSGKKVDFQKQLEEAKELRDDIQSLALEQFSANVNQNIYTYQATVIMNSILSADPEADYTKDTRYTTLIAMAQENQAALASAQETATAKQQEITALETKMIEEAAQNVTGSFAENLADKTELETKISGLIDQVADYSSKISDYLADYDYQTNPADDEKYLKLQQAASEVETALGQAILELKMKDAQLKTFNNSEYTGKTNIDVSKAVEKYQSQLEANETQKAANDKEMRALMKTYTEKIEKDPKFIYTEEKAFQNIQKSNSDLASKNSLINTMLSLYSQFSDADIQGLSI